MSSVFLFENSKNGSYHWKTYGKFSIVIVFHKKQLYHIKLKRKNNILFALIFCKKTLFVLDFLTSYDISPVILPAMLEMLIWF